MMSSLFHYPWRYTLPRDAYAPLPEPKESSISPEIGAYIVSSENSTPEELPCPTIERGNGQNWIVTTDHQKFIYDTLSVYQYQKLATDSPCKTFHYALTDALIWLSDALYRYREKHHQVFADRSCVDVCSQFRIYLGEEKDFAPESLIVEIARDVRVTLQQIIQQPRVVLRREHTMIPIDRLQEIDGFSLLDFARRPGKSAAMKAGPRQKLMGVARHESTDTYENRVILDFIIRTSQVATQYCQSMCSRCPQSIRCKDHDPTSKKCISDRVKLVASFGRLCEYWKRSDNMLGITRLRKPCTRPNYVLLQNALYVKVWRFYQKLLRQENIESDVWRWRRRSFSDIVRIFMMALWEIRLRPNALLQTSEKPFMIRQKNQNGKWLVSDPFEDSLIYQHNSSYLTLYLLNPKEASALLKNKDLYQFNADFFWIVVAPRQKPKICPVWCICRNLKWEKKESFTGYAHGACKEIQSLCSTFSHKHSDIDCTRGWIISEADITALIFSQSDFHFLALDLFSNDTSFEKKMDIYFSLLKGMLK